MCLIVNDIVLDVLNQIKLYILRETAQFTKKKKKKKQLRRTGQKSLTSEKIHEDFPIKLKSDQLRKSSLLISVEINAFFIQK